MTLVLGVPPIVLNLVQQGLLERAFHDALFPSLMFRAEAAWEEWGDHAGTELFMTRKGLLNPVVKPIAAGVDPVPQTLSYEQWVARLYRYASTIDTHMPTSVVANADLFLANIHALGLQAGQSLNRIPRNELFKTYLSGHAVLIQATAAIDTTIRVSSLNGFTDVVIKGTNVRPATVSSTTPLSITIMNGATPIVRNVIGFTADNPDDPYGPGTLILSAAVGAIVAVRSSVLSSAKPRIIRSGGGSNIDAISASDTLVVQDFINATNQLRRANVPPHEDGFYHAHISTEGNSQIFVDPAFQRLMTGKGPESTPYQEAFMGSVAGCAVFMNNETPDDGNSGATTATGTNAKYSEDIGAETVNESGVRIGRVIITGRGVMREKGLDAKQFITEAGVTGKVGEFQTVNAGISVSTERIRLVIRAPLNRLQDQVAASWDISTSFACPSDVSSGGAERFKRGIIIEHALD